jgi:hypothetical protein
MRSLFCLCILAASHIAHAKATSEVGYTLGEAFSTALRYVRIDRGCKLVDKDADAAFISYECKTDAGKPSRGALEIFRAKNQSSRERVRLQVSMPDEPHYIEIRFLELLERKLQDERGTPVAPPDPPKTSPDGGS